MSEETPNFVIDLDGVMTLPIHFTHRDREHLVKAIFWQIELTASASGIGC
jgi:hypothetical protein